MLFSSSVFNALPVPINKSNVPVVFSSENCCPGAIVVPSITISIFFDDASAVSVVPSVVVFVASFAVSAAFKSSSVISLDTVLLETVFVVSSDTALLLYVLDISCNFSFPCLLNSISKYTLTPDCVLLYKTLASFTSSLFNNISSVSESFNSNFPTSDNVDIISSVESSSFSSTTIFPLSLSCLTL